MKLSRAVLLLSGTSVALRFELQKPLDSLPVSGVLSPPSSGSDVPAYRDELVSLHKSLVEISSITYNESAVGKFLVDYLTKRDFVAELQSVPPSNASDSDGKPRFNVLARPGP